MSLGDRRGIGELLEWRVGDWVMVGRRKVRACLKRAQRKESEEGQMDFSDLRVQSRDRQKSTRTRCGTAFAELTRYEERGRRTLGEGNENERTKGVELELSLIEGGRMRTSPRKNKGNQRASFESVSQTTIHGIPSKGSGKTVIRHLMSGGKEWGKGRRRRKRDVDASSERSSSMTPAAPYSSKGRDW